MQHDKNTKKIEQIAKVSKKEEEIANTIMQVVDKFAVVEHLKKFDVAKRSGKLISILTISLILLPFIGASNISSLFKSGLNKAGEGKQNAYYDAKNNEKINWRLFLLVIAKRFTFLLNVDNESLTEGIKKIRAFIFDDSSLEKTGKLIEGVGYIYDHVKHLNILGYKLLLCGYYDGKSFIPLDFYILNENRSAQIKRKENKLNKKEWKLRTLTAEIKALSYRIKTTKKEKRQAQQVFSKKSNKTNKEKLEVKKRSITRLQSQLKTKLKAKKTLNAQILAISTDYNKLKSRHCGLLKKDYKKQHKKQRSRDTAGYRRKQELNENKIDATIKMLKRVVKKGFVADYVITDSWFFCKKILDAVVETGRLHLVSMAKIGTAKYEILPDGKEFNAHQIIALYERKAHYSRKYKSYYISLQANYKGVRVKIFLVKFGSHAKWRMLITTDLKMSFTRLIEVYQIRWTIEVFFKECKQFLFLGKSQAQNLDGQIADITLSLVRYIFLSYYKRIHYGMTIGGIFKELSQTATKENLLTEISYYFMELLKIFADNAGIDFIAFYEDILRDPKINEIISKIGLKTENT